MIVVDSIAILVLGIVLLLGVKNQVRRIRSSFASGKADSIESDE